MSQLLLFRLSLVQRVMSNVLLFRLSLVQRVMSQCVIISFIFSSESDESMCYYFVYL